MQLHYYAPPHNDAALFGCCSDADSACCCIGACACPAVAYGLNYVKATKKSGGEGCCCPCLAHGAFDSALPTLVHFACPAASAVMSVPLGCCLRLTHRRTVLTAYTHSGSSSTKKNNLSLLEDALIELFCWGCSLTQISRVLDAHPASRLDGDDVFGTLSLPVSDAPVVDSSMMMTTLTTADDRPSSSYL